MRKHGNLFFAVLGVILMIIWLNPRTGNSRSDDFNAVRGTLNGKKITNADLQRARNDVYILSAMVDPRASILPVSALPALDSVYTVVSRLNEANRDIHFFLLLKDAEKYGINAGSDEVQTLEGRMALSPADLQRFLGALHTTEPTMQTALRDCLIIYKYETLVFGCLQPSIPQLRRLATDIGAKVSFRYLTLDATTPGSDVPTPSAEAIAKQYSTYRGVLPETAATEPPLIDGHTYPFAYKYPDRVKIEFLTFDRAAIRKYLHDNPSRDNAEKAMLYYQEHPSEFTVESTSPPSTAKGFMDESATAPAAGTRLRAYAEVKDQVLARILDEATDKALAKMIDTAEKLAAEPWNRVPLDANGFHVAPPAGFQPASYEQIAQQIQKQQNYLPTYTAPQGWLDRTQLAAEPGIGTADFRSQQNTVLADFPALALHVEEIAGTARFAGRSMQVGVEGPVLKDAEGNRYLFRIIAAEAAHEPPSIDDDEVRARVILDLRRAATYERYVGLGAQLAAEAAKSGLDATGRAHGWPVNVTDPFTRLSARPPQSAAELTRRGLQPSIIPGLGVVPPLSDAAFKLATDTFPTGTAHASSASSVPASTAPATSSASSAPATRPGGAAGAASQAARPRDPRDRFRARGPDAQGVCDRDRHLRTALHHRLRKGPGSIRSARHGPDGPDGGGQPMVPHRGCRQTPEFRPQHAF